VAYHDAQRHEPAARRDLPEPFVEVHPDDAALHGLQDEGFARVTTAHGACVLKVRVAEGQQRGSLFVPIHWSDETAASARVGALVASPTDPYSGQPEAKATPSAIAPVDFALRGFVLSRRPLALPRDDVWTRLAVPGGVGYLLASNADPATWRALAHGWHDPMVERAEYVDTPRAAYRMAAFVDGRLDLCLFVGPAAAAPQWNAARALFESATVAEPQRRMLLSGRSADGLPDLGPVICACFGVGLSAIRDALGNGAASDVEEIGRALRAGTNCGSCLPELKRIVAQAQVREAVG
jgi:assimilatory nitrate reductase catalytic subunit